MEKKKQEEEAYSHIQMDKSSCTRSHTLHYLDLFKSNTVKNKLLSNKKKKRFSGEADFAVCFALSTQR